LLATLQLKKKNGEQHWLYPIGPPAKGRAVQFSPKKTSRLKVTALPLVWYFNSGKAAYRSHIRPRAAFFWLLGLVQFKFQPFFG
tara:strand:- start:442 stop:693 length:252 start_codon:yes stop_codon:yes gene_type:complete